MATSSGAPYTYDSSTRSGKGPIYNWAKVGPIQVATVQGTGPAFTSKVYQNTSTNPLAVHVQIHNLDQTTPSNNAATPSVQKFVQLFIVTAAAITVPAASEVVNVGLITTETWWSPRPFILGVGEMLLALNTSGQPCSISVDVWTLV